LDDDNNNNAQNINQTHFKSGFYDEEANDQIMPLGKNENGESFSMIRSIN
jgi:hypothetical protein